MGIAPVPGRRRRHRRTGKCRKYVHHAPGAEGDLSRGYLIVKTGDAPHPAEADIIQGVAQDRHIGLEHKVIAHHDVAVLQIVYHPFVGQLLFVEPAPGRGRPMLSRGGWLAVVGGLVSFGNMVGGKDRDLVPNTIDVFLGTAALSRAASTAGEAGEGEAGNHQDRD